MGKVPRHEFELIQWFRQQAESPSGRVAVGIGDDAAVLRSGQASLVVTCDVLMDGVHFRTSETSLRQIGRKTLAVNLSDLAAMAARPVAALVGLVLPRQGGGAVGKELMEGLAELAQQFQVEIIGGDTNAWNGPLVVSVTALGEVGEAGPVLRCQAQPGDWIFVTGELGGSLLGKHLDFQPRVEEAQRLQQLVQLHAMIDVSDGLVVDLAHILEESGVGAVLEAEAVPVSKAAQLAASRDGRSALEHALHDGEDFELLFTVSPEDGRRLLAHKLLDLPLSKIGEILSERKYVLRCSDGSEKSLPLQGWLHRFE